MPRRYIVLLVALAAYVAAAFLGTEALARAPLPVTGQSDEPAYRVATTSGMAYELRRFTRWRVERVGQIAAEDEDGISGDLALAHMSRETAMLNIVGGGYFDTLGRFIVTGEDRGLLQINERFHASFLERTPGAASGSYKTVYDSALPRGRVPGLTAATRYAIGLLRLNIQYATRAGVQAADAVRVAVAGYNCGIVAAVAGWREGNVDRYTTGGDYSRDVLDRRTKIRRARRELRFR